MSPDIVIPLSLRVGEVLSLGLGFGLTTLAVCARLYTKVRIDRKMMIEDYFSVLAWLSFLAYIGLAIIIGRNGGEVIHTAYLSTIEKIIYDPIIVLVKTSILLQYITLFVARRGNIFHYAVHIVLWINVIFYTIITFLYIFHCTPRQKQWDPSISGHCLDNHQSGELSGWVNAVTDFLILILPLPLIWRLHMSWKKKSRLLVVFGLGSFAFFSSIIRLIYSIKLSDDNPSDVAHQLDVDRQGLWAFAEIAIGIIVGCIPTLPKFFKHFSSKMPALPTRFKVFSSTSSGVSWRRFFRKSTASETSTPKRSPVSGSFLGKGAFKSKAPYTETLDLTCISFSSAEKDLQTMALPFYNNQSFLLSKNNSLAENTTDHQTWYSESATPSSDLTKVDSGDKRV